MDVLGNRYDVSTLTFGGGITYDILLQSPPSRHRRHLCNQRSPRRGTEGIGRKSELVYRIRSMLHTPITSPDQSHAASSEGGLGCPRVPLSMHRGRNYGALEI